MYIYGIEVDIKNKPELDRKFVPILRFNEAFLKTASRAVSIAIERGEKQVSQISTYVHDSSTHAEADAYYLERLVKFELWLRGGFKIYVKGPKSSYESLKKAFSPEGSRAFDAEFFGGLYQRDFEVVSCDELPEPFEIKKSVGGHFDGCRIGVDFGGSDYKVAAVIDGKVVYNNETVWNPKINSDPDYHFNGAVSAMKEAKDHLPHVDAIGISSAGLISGNRILAAQLFQMVPKELFDEKSRDTYIRAVKEIGDGIPFEVANDGDVAALAAAIGLQKNNVLGLAMGTSYIGGFIDKDGNLSNWISELAFAPMDASPNAAMDDWTKDIGVGVQYFCQEAVIKLSKAAGISLDGYETPAEKLKVAQNLLDESHAGATAIFRTIGCYLGHTVPFYFEKYKADSILLLGRVVSGKGGDIILETANQVLKEEYPDLVVELLLPDEKTRRMGQSVAAASLPKINK